MTVVERELCQIYSEDSDLQCREPAVDWRETKKGRQYLCAFHWDMVTRIRLWFDKERMAKTEY